MGSEEHENVIKNKWNLFLLMTMLASLKAAGSVIDKADNQGQPIAKEVDQLAFCESNLDHTIGRRLLYISTLDGRLSTLDITKGGKLLWTISTEPGPLISSSIHHIELTSNGQFVRMIPSLSGGIYKFDGESIEPIPISVDNLLNISTKFSEDLFISGGKEMRSYGISARTGQLLYECSMNGCLNSTDRDPKQAITLIDDVHPQYLVEHDPVLDDVILVRRLSQTVRVIVSRTGVERWNFNVGQHELDLIKSVECHDKTLSDLDKYILDLDIKVNVPEGVIYAVRKIYPNDVLWKYKFDHPIVSAWKIGASTALEQIDMFVSAQWLWNEDGIDPSIYLGIYEKQLYIQESINLRKFILAGSNFHSHLTNESKFKKIQWKPILAKASSLTTFLTNPAKTIQSKELLLFDGKKIAIFAQSVLNASAYFNGNGFYLYAGDYIDRAFSGLCDSNTENLENVTVKRNIIYKFGFSFIVADPPVKVVILSVWFWWKEFIAIALTSVLILNVYLRPRSRTEREIVVIERHIPISNAIEANKLSTVDNIQKTSLKNNSTYSLSETLSHTGEHFFSRFQGDFDLVRCLGRGGFGVVFEAKNKLDDCKYAVKRITLSNKKESRSRVMREVKTLANCEHQNIVRYFQAWVETPPPGWQEEEDKKWIDGEMSASVQIESPYDRTAPSTSFCSSNLRYTRNGTKFIMPALSNITKTKSSNTTYSKSFVDENLGNEFLQDGDEYNNNADIYNDSASVDINLKSTKVIETAKRKQSDFDCSALSDSFQIEFVYNLSNTGKYKIADEKESNHNRDEEFNALDISCVNQSGQLLPPSKKKHCEALIPSTTLKKNQEKRNKIFLYIQMQLCRKESLRDWLCKNNTDDRHTHINSIFQQIVNAVDYVHFKGLIHRDLKPSNIFFSQDGKIKIGDFGLVTDMSDIPNLVTKCGDKSGLPICARHTQQVGTHLYMSPEQLTGQHYDFKVDIYSLGLIFFELLFYFGTEMERIVTLRNLREGKFPNHFQDDYPLQYALLKKMLSSMPEERPTTMEIKIKLNSIITPT